ncbi:MmcB family DNA repair protein [Maritalea sp.]|uniref:MmcB family DNA repair protein n=1 Tax=Maritalea sp. TaxID=2003361 RepID=UPI003EF43B0A
MTSHLENLPPIIDGRQSETALRVQRGTMRLLRQRFDFCCYAEVTLATGRRADLLGVGPKGDIWIIEIKSSLQDYQVDNKWPEYSQYCDRFFFAKPPELNGDIFPEDEGLIVADGHGAEILRPAQEDKLPAARRKAIMLRIARMGADRIHHLMDPGPNAL